MLEGALRRVCYALEGWLILEITGDRLGHLAFPRELIDMPDTGNTLHFKLALDRNFLPSLLNDLECVLTEYPLPGQ